MKNQSDISIAKAILEDALANPELAGLFAQMLKDQNFSKTKLLHTAFAQGVISTLHALREGSLLDLGSN